VLRIDDDRILITSRTEAARILSSSSELPNIAYVVSIGDDGEAPPPGFRNVRRRLRLVFDDETTTELGGPTRSDIESLVRFAQTVDLSEGRLLVHCQAGISPSAAATAVILATVFGPGHERYIACLLGRLYPHCRPNRLMLKLADEILKTDGALERVWSTHSE